MIKEKISFVLIAHNEETVIGRMVEGLLSRDRDKMLEIIVIDDSSTDDTSSIVALIAKRDNKVRLIKKGAPSGVGYAIKTGFNNVSKDSEYVLTMDSDFIDSLDDVGRLIKKMETGEYDGVIGSRFTRGGRLENYPHLKKVMNRMFHFIVRILFNVKQKDLTNNFKLYKIEIIRKMPWHSGGFSINAETGLLPILAGYNVVEVPVVWIGRSEDMGKSKFKLFKVGLGYINVILYAVNFVSKVRKGATG